MTKQGREDRAVHVAGDIIDVFSERAHRFDRVGNGRLPERTNGAASKAVVASGSPWVRIPHLPPCSFCWGLFAAKSESRYPPGA